MANPLAYVEDLMFLSRIQEAAKGVPVEVPRDLAALLEACRRSNAPLVLVDLDGRRLEALSAIRSLRQAPDLAGVPVVAFVGHVHVARAQAAREAGATLVLARSAFVRELPGILAAGVHGRSLRRFE